jgi:acyl-CoA thioester hydrolase
MSTPAPVVITIPVAWGEMDAFHHVNNVAYFRYIESARVAFCREIGWMPGVGEAASGVWPILHSAQIRFRAPVNYPDTLTISATPSAIEADRFTLSHALTSTAQGRVVAEGSGIIVSYDFARATKAPIPGDVLSRLLPLAARPS